jgi:lysozyme
MSRWPTYRVLLCWIWLALSGCGGEEGDPGWRSFAVHTVCGGSTTVKGIDVSKYQATVDWQAVKGAGVEFAFARVSDGVNNPDAYFAGNWTGMQQAGIIRGAYQYFRPAQDPQAQAQLLIQAIQNAGGLDPKDLPPVIDVETSSGVSGSALAAKMDVWLNAVEQAFNRKPIIYSGSYFWDSAGLSSSYTSYPLWVPNYTENPCPKLPSPWSEWKFWQHSDKGSVAGVGGNVDLNKFNGTLSELQAFVVSTSTATEPPPPPPPSEKQPPKGQLEGASCQGIRGWAQDPDNPTAAVHVRIYVDQPPSGTIGVATDANRDRPDLCSTLGSCKHGFDVPIPPRFLDGQPHQVQVVAIDTNSPDESLLEGGPRTFTCGVPGAPSTPPDNPSAPEPPSQWPSTDPGSGPGAPGLQGGCSVGGGARFPTSALLALLLLLLRRRG